MNVSSCLDLHVDQGVLGKRSEHVIVEGHAGIDRVRPTSVEINRDSHVRLTGLSRHRCNSLLCRHSASFKAALNASFSAWVPTVTRR